MKLLDYPSLLKSFVAELGKELAMRRTVWRVIPGTSHKFGSPEKQSRYDSMRLMEKIFKEMNTRELQTIVERIERKKLAARKSTPKLFSLILILLFLSFGTQAQKISEFNAVDTIDQNSILEVFTLDQHLKFYHPNQMLDIKVAYKPTGGKYKFKESFEKSGAIKYAAIHLGKYKFVIRDSVSSCKCIIEVEFLDSTSEIKSIQTYHLECMDANYPNPNKPIRKL